MIFCGFICFAVVPLTLMSRNSGNPIIQSIAFSAGEGGGMLGGGLEISSDTKEMMNQMSKV